ncbi:MAG TPA: bifunctional DNA-formamidopyrimidine glycosylase/DNA-(apurinic or apyrimidinic site) lyase [Trueperaceae bacterium]|nr:bifunctional DNA-formamidopyrimidine glycosylase/DNA-(apurinic or apyrimidinic site) lyase [Trueperaceae bacterium]
MRRELEPWLKGREIGRVERLAPAGPKYANLERAAGQRVLDVGRRGKFILAPLAGGDELVIHLGMTGSISADEPTGAAAGHVRVKVHLAGDGPPTLYFRDARRFGRFLVVPAGEYESLPTLAALGPEPFDEELTPARFAANLRRSGMAVKTYLMSQRPVAGVGNIYADEALWRARLHPETPARDVPEAPAGDLLAAIRAVLAESLAANGTTLRDYRRVGGETGEFFESLAVYGKAGEPCSRCGTQMVKSVVGQRGTVHCPHCQRLRRSRRSGKRRGAGP